MLLGSTNTIDDTADCHHRSVLLALPAASVREANRFELGREVRVAARKLRWSVSVGGSCIFFFNRYVQRYCFMVPVFLIIVTLVAFV